MPAQPSSHKPFTGASSALAQPVPLALVQRDRAADAARHGLVRPERIWPSQLPADWLLVSGKGQRPDAECMAALKDAHQTITRFRGYADLSDNGAAFVRAIARDALVVAPQPVRKTWVRYTLSTVSGLVGWCEESGQPLDRQHVLSSQVRHRYLTVVRADMATAARGSYRARLDLIANAVLNAGEVVYVDRPSLIANDVVTPYTVDEEAALWSFGQVMRPVTRQHRYRALLALTFGLGAPRRDVTGVRPEHVRVDADGVHVLLGNTDADSLREVTCLAAWEPDLLGVVDLTPHGRPIVAPDRVDAHIKFQIDAAVQKVNAMRPPVPFMMTRARNTWIARHLALGTPLRLLMQAANVKHVGHMADLLAWVPDVDPQTSRRYLRGASA